MTIVRKAAYLFRFLSVSAQHGRTEPEIVTAILSGRKDPASLSPFMWDNLQRKLLTQVNCLDTSSLSKAVHALAKMNKANRTLLETVGLRSLAIDICQTSSTVLIDLADAFGRSRYYHADLFRTISLKVHSEVCKEKLSLRKMTTLAVACGRVLYQDQSLFDTLSRGLIGEVDRMSIATMAHIVWAFVRTRMIHCELAPELLIAIQNRLLIAFSDPNFYISCCTQSITDLMWAYAEIGEKLGRYAESCQLINYLARFLQPKIFVCSPHSLSSLLWAYAKMSPKELGFQPMEDLLQRAGNHAQQLVPVCRSNGCLATMIWSFSKVDFYHAGFFQALGALPLGRWSSFRPKDLSRAAWGIANSQQPSHSSLQSIADASVQCFSKFTAKELCSVIWSIAKTCPADCLTFFEAAVLFVPPFFPVLTSNEIITTLSAFTIVDNLSGTGDHRRHKLIDDLIQQIQPYVIELSPNDLAMLCRSVGTWKSVDISQGARPLLAECVSRLHAEGSDLINQFVPIALADLLVGLSRAAIFDETVFSLSAVCCAAKIKGFPVDSLISAVQSFAIAGMDHAKWLSKVNRRLCDISATLSLRHISEIMFHLATLSSLDEITALHFANLVHPEQCTSEQLIKVAWAVCVACPATIHPAGLQPFWHNAAPILASYSLRNDISASDEVLLQNVRRDRVHQLKHILNTNDDKQCGLFPIQAEWRQEIVSLLEFLQYRVMASRCPLSGYHLDVTLPERKIAILLEDQSSYGRLCHQPFGHTVLRRRHLSRAGWNVVPITWWMWSAQTNTDLAIKFLISCVSPNQT